MLLDSGFLECADVIKTIRCGLAFRFKRKFTKSENKQFVFFCQTTAARYILESFTLFGSILNVYRRVEKSKTFTLTKYYTINVRFIQSSYSNFGGSSIHV